VGIGASAGGLEAVTQLLQALPPHTGMGFVLIQHLNPTRASMLPEILARATQLPVTEVSRETAVEPDHLYVVSPGVDMVISNGQLEPSPRPAHAEHREIDRFLSSLAEERGYKAVGVILSGGGIDGTVGLQMIKAENGVTFAQDDSAQHGSMPRSAIAAGCVDLVLPPAEIARELARIARHPYVVRTSAEQSATEQPHETQLGQILEALQNIAGVDFAQYKRSTLNRRIARRMVLHRMDGLPDYVELLRGNPKEVQALCEDILINVTSFFRNVESFEALKVKVLPRLTAKRSKDDPVRVWVVGCSTGEEAYSIAMTLVEYAEASGRFMPIQIFATDLNGKSIERARAGIYPKAIVHDVMPERLRRFFVEADGDSYRVSKSLRDLCVFAKHNALVDPPFSRMDLIICRNLMIYLEPTAQKRLVPVLHYALKPEGFLWMGNSETLGSYRDLFEIDDVKHKIYLKKTTVSRSAVPVAFNTTHPRDRPRESQKPPILSETAINGLELQREAERVLVQKFAPPGVLVNQQGEILQFRGDTGLFLTPAPGKASLDLLKMLREGLLVAVRGALHKAKSDNTAVREEGLRVRTNDGYRDVDIEVLPIKGASARENCFMVLFAERSAAVAPASQDAAAEGPAGKAAGEPSESAERRMARLTQELAATREYLQSVIEQQEAANEELQASNEEVQSGNEELQSINEELETSKEEIQSSNEELSTVNDELHQRNRELGQANNDFINLLSSVQMAIVMLGPNLRIRRFTPMAETMLNLIPTDVGRSIGDIKLNVDVTDLEDLLTDAIDTVRVREREVRDKRGRWHLLRIHPYKTVEGKTDGAVMVLVDVDSLKRSEETARRQTELLEQTHEPIIMWELGGHITYWNRGAEETYGYTAEQANGRPVHELLKTFPPPATFTESLQKSGRWRGELNHIRQDGRQIVIESLMVLVRDGADHPLVIETDRDVTERKSMERALQERADQLTHADRAKNEFLAMLAHELRNPLAPLRNAAEILKAPQLDTAGLQFTREVIARQVKHMARLVEDLVDVSRVTQGKVVLQKRLVEATSVLNAAIETARHYFDARGQQLDVSLAADELRLYADPFRLEQVVVNLLDNASKFTSNGGKVWLMAESDRAAGSSPSGSVNLIVRVRDNGSGISTETQKHVFDLFMQGSRALDRAQGGLGVGLTLVKKLVEMHEGSVQINSAGVGLGTEVVVRLPAASPPHAAIAPSERAAGPAPRKVLVVDDNVDAAQSLAILLSKSGHELQVAHDAPTAIGIAAAFKPEVVLLDLGLPGQDGFEVARRLRQEIGLHHARLVALSGYGQDEYRARARDAGFDEYLTKPVDPDKLQGTLRAGEGDSS